VSQAAGSLKQLMQDSWSDWSGLLLWLARSLGRGAVILAVSAGCLLGPWLLLEQVQRTANASLVSILGVLMLWTACAGLANAFYLAFTGFIERSKRSLVRAWIVGAIQGLAMITLCWRASFWPFFPIGLALWFAAQVLVLKLRFGPWRDFFLFGDKTELDDV